jgi:hypothetical protein
VWVWDKANERCADINWPIPTSYVNPGPATFTC